MIYIWIIVIGGIIHFILTRNPDDSFKNKIRTKDGYPKIDVINVQCDDIPQGVDVLLTCDEGGLFIKTNGRGNWRLRNITSTI